MSKRAYAVRPKALPRSASYSPLSIGWTLYNPEDLAKEVSVPVDTLHRALEKTGFNKAVRIREELIRWKTRLIQEQKELTAERTALQEQLAQLNKRDAEIKDTLVNIRNILRISREAPTDE